MAPYNCRKKLPLSVLIGSSLPASQSIYDVFWILVSKLLPFYFRFEVRAAVIHSKAFLATNRHCTASRGQFLTRKHGHISAYQAKSVVKEVLLQSPNTGLSHRQQIRSIQGLVLDPLLQGPFGLFILTNLLKRYLVSSSFAKPHCDVTGILNWGGLCAPAFSYVVRTKKRSTAVVRV